MTKEHLNNRGYNKFLKLTGEVAVEIDETKVAKATLWDGLKGYLTNTDLAPQEIIENYGQLWRIERASRKRTCESVRCTIGDAVGSKPMSSWLLSPTRSTKSSNVASRKRRSQ